MSCFLRCKAANILGFKQFSSNFPTLQKVRTSSLTPILPLLRHKKRVAKAVPRHKLHIKALSSSQVSEEMSKVDVKMNKSQRLALLREQMSSASLGAYVVPTSDPHLLEYVPDSYKRREFISGFTGSTGTAVITLEKAALWTDGRYFLQAEKELSEEWTLMKMGTKDCPRMTEWLKTVLEEGSKVGVDPFCHSETELTNMKKAVEEKNLEIVSVEKNLIDIIWGEDRPAFPQSLIHIHPLEFAGETTEVKLGRIREKFQDNKVDAIFVSTLDEIAWVLNLRGGDEPYSPIFISYLLIRKEDAIFYVDKNKVSQEIADYLSSFSISIDDYENAVDGVKETVKQAKNIWLDPDLINGAVFEAARNVKEKSEHSESVGDIVSKSAPIESFKAVKNEAELNGMREAHLRDGVAIVEFLSWLEKEIENGKVISEVDIDIELTARRAAQKGFKSLSFPTIAGAGPNGAIIHYRASPDTCANVTQDTLLLIDSGGQYDCGTTDVTRTFHLGVPTEHQMMCFTKVLQGHIGLASAIFPGNTPGTAIDAFARKELWAVGLDYCHGTGHGVGAHLCVHEGPISISFRYFSPKAQSPLKAGMIVSDEPGYYEDGNFGIRIENLVIIKEANTPFTFGDTKYLGFELLTFVPIQKKMVDLKLLNKAEITWMNNYHKEVYEKLSPRVSDEARKWLERNTLPL